MSLASDMEVLTAHLGISNDADPRAVLREAPTVLTERFQLSHATLQVESAGDHEREEMAW